MARFLRNILFFALLFTSLYCMGGSSEEIVGNVNGVPVTREELKSARSPESLFIGPAASKYFETRKELITPTDAELAIVEANVREGIALRAKNGDDSANKTDAKFIAKFLVSGWKYNKYLYDTFGGGRLLFQQAGVEAFDATHNFLKYLEAEKYFEIHDAEVRAQVFAYWVSSHGAFMIDDEAQISDWRDIKSLGK